MHFQLRRSLICSMRRRHPEWKKGEQPLGLSKMRELAAAARDVGRDPVKTNFTDQDRSIVRSFIESRKQMGTPRRESFLGLCGLLGRRLDASHWHLLDTVDKVRNSAFPRGWSPDTKGSGTNGLDQQMFWTGGSRVRSVRGGDKPDFLQECGYSASLVTRWVKRLDKAAYRASLEVGSLWFLVLLFWVLFSGLICPQASRSYYLFFITCSLTT